MYVVRAVCGTDFFLFSFFLKTLELASDEMVRNGYELKGTALKLSTDESLLTMKKFADFFVSPDSMV